MFKYICAVLMLLFIQLSVYADDTTITTCDFTSLSDAFTRINVNGGAITIDCDGTILIPFHFVIRKDVVIEATGELILDGEGESLFFLVSEGASLTVKNITFQNGNGLDGGAIINNGTLSIENSRFINNQSTQGGAIFNQGIVTISDSEFVDNSVSIEGTSEFYGGAIFSFGEGELTVNNTRFIGNEANYGGAIAVISSSLTISESYFENNIAQLYGGAILQYQGLITITDTQFVGNQSADGGAISASDTFLNLSGSQFTANVASVRGGALVIAPETRVSILNSTFSENRADDEGGVIYSMGQITIVNSTFWDNHAALGDVLYNIGTDVYTASAVIQHSTLVNGDETDESALIHSGEYSGVGLFATIISDTHEVCSGTEGIIADATNLASHACGEAQVVEDMMLGEFDGTVISLLPNSPAIDFYPTPCVALSDQLDTSRPQGAGCDAGAVELPIE